MYNRVFKFVFVLFCFTIAASSNAHPDTHKEPPFEIVSHDWEGKIPVNKVVYVKNNYGSIRSRSNTEEKVFLHATYQKIGNKALSPTFDIKEMDGNLYITINYDESIRDSNGALRGRTDISVLFPPTVKIIAETTSGMIKIDKTHSNVDAKTTTGKIKLTTTGLFHVFTHSGKIDLRLRGMDTLGESSAISDSGEIHADIFNDMDIKLNAETNGHILVDEENIKNSQYTLNQGTESSIVSFSSQKGNIKINVVKPPALIKSVTPTNKKVDLRELPKSKPWKKGDPVKEVNPKRRH